MRSLSAAALALCLTAGSALAQSGVLLRQFPQAELVESYVAFIGPDDLYNSSGQRLTRPWQILRQDRANFHAYGIRDPADQADTFFTSPVNRAEMEFMLSRGYISGSAAARVVNGGVFVRVQLLGIGDVGTAIRVDVL